MKKKCIGCGIELQCEFPNKDGYLQAKILKENRAEHYCERCFKIKNYGKDIPVTFSKEDYQKEVAIASDSAELALAVFDIIDFEGSFDTEILDILREKESIIVVNKLDLIPDGKHPSEVAHWVKQRLAEEGIAPIDIAIISTKNGYGVNGIYRKITHFYPNGVEVVVLGVTNVGKSSLINKLIGAKIVTVSKYPGTTLKNNRHMIPNSKVTLIDTPGLIPEGRISDLVCGECNLKIIPSGEISRKTYKLDVGRVLFIGGLIDFRVLKIIDAKPIISNERVDVFGIPCKECISEYKKLKMKKNIITVEAGEELAFTGLGWLTVKRGPLVIEVNLPEEIEVIIRKAFIKPRR